VALSEIQGIESVDLGNGSSRSLIALGGSWNQIGNDFVGDAPDDSAWATSISGEGSRIVIGALGSDKYGTNRGIARVYEISGSGWVQVGNDIHGVNDGDYCGRAVSISGDGEIIAVGEIGYSGGTMSSGRVRVFRFVGNDWTLLGGEADIVGVSLNDRLGEALSLSNDGKVIVIGAPQAIDKTGYAVVYTFDGFAWNQVGASIVGATFGDRVGDSVDVSSDGGIVAIGCHANYVRIFEVKDEGLDELSSLSGNGTFGGKCFVIE